MCGSLIWFCVWGDKVLRRKRKGACVSACINPSISLVCLLVLFVVVSRES